MVLFIFMRFHINIPGLGTEVGILKTELPLFLSNKYNIHSNMPENPLL